MVYVRSRRHFWELLVCAALLSALSWLTVQAGVHWGHLNIPPGQGYPPLEEPRPDLFRFDSYHYLKIAQDGYAYNGDPASSPNIVFAPLYPLLVQALANTFGADEIATGFVLNEVLLFAALLMLFSALGDWFGRGPAFLSLFALVTSAGSYSLHAFYSESMTLFCLALGLFSLRRQWWLVLALATACLGASRLAMLPLVAVISGLLLARAWNRRSLGLILAALLCWAGVASYLLYLAVTFGNPFEILPEIQSVSWGLFHPEISWLSLLTGGYLWTDWQAAFERGSSSLQDIKTINLIWFSLGLVTCLHWAYRRPTHVLTFLFVPYFIFLYWSGGASDFLISGHRFFLLMLPLFLMFTDLHRWLARRSSVVAWVTSVLLLAMNLAYGVFLAGSFNQGVWYFF